MRQRKLESAGQSSDTKRGHGNDAVQSIAGVEELGMHAEHVGLVVLYDGGVIPQMVVGYMEDLGNDKSSIQGWKRQLAMDSSVTAA